MRGPRGWLHQGPRALPVPVTPTKTSEQWCEQGSWGGTQIPEARKVLFENFLAKVRSASKGDGPFQLCRGSVSHMCLCNMCTAASSQRRFGYFKSQGVKVTPFLLCWCLWRCLPSLRPCARLLHPTSPGSWACSGPGEIGLLVHMGASLPQPSDMALG